MNKYIFGSSNYKFLLCSERQPKINVQVGLVAPPTLACLLKEIQRGANMVKLF